MKFLLNFLFLCILMISVVSLFLFLIPKIEKLSSYLPLGYDEHAPMPAMLHPYVKKHRDLLISKAEEKGIFIVITDGHRSVERQKSLYAQGRSSEGTIVTHAQAGESYHNYGLAIDFALQLDHGDVVWDMNHDGNENGKSDWMEVVAIAKKLGFEWGGDWRGFKDYPHLQMDFGLSIRELKRGKRPDFQINAEK